nr:hypothetical protein [Tanacetum cinerariifolium]
DCKTTRNPRNKGRDAGNAGYRGRDNGKRPAKEEATDFALMAFTSNPSSFSSSNSETRMPMRFDKLRRQSKTRNILGNLWHIILLRVRNLILNDGSTWSRR